MLRKLKIFPKIFINCFLIAIVPLAGLFYQITINEADQREEVENRLSQIAEIISSEVDNWTDKNLRNSRFLADMDAFKTMAAQQQVPILKVAKENLEWVSLIFVKDTNGDAVARSDGKRLRNYSDREYFRQVVSGQEMGQQVLIGKAKPVPLHCFAIPINNDRLQLAGIITQCSTLLKISEYIVAGNVGQTGFAFLVDDKNRLIAHGQESGKLVGDLQDVSGHPALSLPENQVTTLNHEGKDTVFTTHSVGPGWRLVVQQDYNEAYSSYLATKFDATVLAIITVITTLILSFLISYNISTPVKKLTEIADAYSKGLFIENIPGQDRHDELGDLAKATARMAKTIQMAMSRLRRQKAKSQ